MFLRSASIRRIETVTEMQKKMKLLLLEGSAAASVGVDVAVIAALARWLHKQSGI